jgi:hypothetical protein
MSERSVTESSLFGHKKEEKKRLMKIADEEFYNLSASQGRLSLG